MYAFMTAFPFENKTGVIGMLQLATRTARNSSDILRDLELLEHCCMSEFGFAIALESREMIEWLDSLCTQKVCADMVRDPNIFQRVCLCNDWQVLETSFGHQYADKDSVKAFRIIHEIVHRMDSLHPKEVEGFHQLFLSKRNGIAERAYALHSSQKSFFVQPEWMSNAVPLKCGRYYPPSDVFYKQEAAPSNSLTQVAVAYVSNNNAAVASASEPSPEEFAKMLKQARDVTGFEVDEKQFRSILAKCNYNLDEAVISLLG